MRTFTSLGLVTFALCPLTAAAQVSRPERAAEIVSRSTDQTRSTETMDFSMSFLGGYDQNDSEQFQIVDPLAPPVFVDTSSTATINAGLSYNRAKQTRVLGLTLNGGTSFYGGATENVGPTKNIGGGLTWSRPLGSASRFSFSERVVYDSLFSVAAFEPIAGDIAIDELPGSETQGVAELDSLSSATTVGLEHRLGRRNALNGSVGYNLQRYSGQESSGNNTSTGATIEFSRQMQRTTALTMAYGYSSGEYAPLIDGGGTRPLVGHMIQGGMNFSKRLSPRRAAQFSFSVGASRTAAATGGDAIGYSFWAPSGSASARVDLGRTWALSSNYSHGTTALSGLTREAYNSSAFNTSLGGSVGRVVLVFTGGLARGATDVGVVDASDYISYTGAAQASVPIGGHLSALVEYSWYSYEVNGSTSLPSSLPPDFQRRAIRAGLTLGLPIIQSR